jgi:hypothetical protein
MPKEKKDYWNDLGSQLWRTVINKGEIYYPPKLRGKVEYHIKKNGRVVIRPVTRKKHEKKKKL